MTCPTVSTCSVLKTPLYDRECPLYSFIAWVHNFTLEFTIYRQCYFSFKFHSYLVWFILFSPLLPIWNLHSLIRPLSTLTNRLIPKDSFPWLIRLLCFFPLLIQRRWSSLGRRDVPFPHCPLFFSLLRHVGDLRKWYIKWDCFVDSA